MNSYIGIIRTSCGASFTYIYPIFWTSFSNSFSFRIFPASYIFFQPDRVYILLSVRIHHIIFHRLRWNFFWKFTKNREDSLQKIFFKTYTKNLTNPNLSIAKTYSLFKLSFMADEQIPGVLFNLTTFFPCSLHHCSTSLNLPPLWSSPRANISKSIFSNSSTHTVL